MAAMNNNNLVIGWEVSLNWSFLSDGSGTYIPVSEYLKDLHDKALFQSYIYVEHFCDHT